MSKATSTTTTAVPANTPGLPLSSRRRMLAGSGVATIAAAFALPLATPPVHAAPTDPVVTLYAKWRTVMDAEIVADNRFSELRALLVQRYGETNMTVAIKAWKRDSVYAEFEANRNKSNELSNENVDLLEVMQAMPATSIEGIRCKLLAALETWKFIEQPHIAPDPHEAMTVAFLRDAVRVLGGSAAA